MLQQPLSRELCDASAESVFGDKLPRIVHLWFVHPILSRTGLCVTSMDNPGDADGRLGIDCCELLLAAESRENRKLLRIGLGDSKGVVPLVPPNIALSSFALDIISRFTDNETLESRLSRRRLLVTDRVREDTAEF